MEKFSGEEAQTSP